MKTMFTMMTAMMISIAAISQQFNTVLNFRLQNNTTFALMVNGVQVSNLNTRATVENLRPGRHQISVAVPVQQRFHHHRRHVAPMQTIYTGWINVAPNRIVYASLDRFNSFVVEHTVAMNNPRGRWNSNPYHTNWDNPYDNFDIYHTHHVNYQPQPQIMDALTFQQLKETINRTQFESTKQSILNQSVSNFWFTTHQVRELIGLFTFESTKLDVAKRMYDRTVDRQNYFTVSNTFTFSSSVVELNDYLAQR